MRQCTTHSSSCLGKKCQKHENRYHCLAQFAENVLYKPTNLASQHYHITLQFVVFVLISLKCFASQYKHSQRLHADEREPTVPIYHQRNSQQQHRDYWRNQLHCRDCHKLYWRPTERVFSTPPQRQCHTGTFVSGRAWWPPGLGALLSTIMGAA